MASSTKHYGLGFFDFGDSLSNDFSAHVEIERFTQIDSLLYGLMSIFGNGIIEGWKVEAKETFGLSIGEGFGNINFTSARTVFPTFIDNIPPNSTNYVFAKMKATTTFAEDVEFVLTPNTIIDVHFLLIAKVTTGPLSIELIENNGPRIDFIELIKHAVRDHKHRGGSLNPSKIDLTSEVKGQLPSFRIADFDAEKITTGTFDLARMPLIDHQQLLNTGLLTHPQLDSFVKTLETNNREIFGEIGTSNLLQLIIAMKLIYDDPESAFYFADRKSDEGMINQFVIIPGVTTNDHIDFDHSTATIDLSNHHIEGIAPNTGTSFYVTYNTDLAWNSAYSKENVIVSGGDVTLAFNEEDESSIVTIEGFESATEPGQDLSGGTGGQELFKKETVIISDNANITANSTATNVMEGFYSGKFQHQQAFRSQFVKTFTNAQNWTTYDSFVLSVKCLDSIHGPVKLYFVSSDGEKSIEYVVLESNEVTNSIDVIDNNFELRVVNLATVPFRNKIQKIVIFTDDLVNPFKFYIDFINIQRAVLLPEQGTLNIRYSSAVKLTFSSIDWQSLEPTGTEISVRARAAVGTVFLTRAEYTPNIASSDLLNIEGTDIEIEITFRPDTDRIVAPVLQQLRILIITQADVDGFVINTTEAFERGNEENVTINSSPTSLSVSDDISVNSYYFCLGNAVGQVHEETNAAGNSFVNSELSISGNNTPLSPNQLWRTIEEGGIRATTPRLFEPRSVRRQPGKTFVVADTYNDRVLEFNEDGSLLSGVGSINYEHGDKVFPVAGSFDPRTGILYIVWSKKIAFNTINVSKITLQTSSSQVQLIRDFDKILGATTTELGSLNAEGQIMPVFLSKQNAALAEDLTNGKSYMFVSGDVMPTGLSSDSVFYKAMVTTLGIPLFVGNFAYIDGIFSPTFADKTDDGGFIIANATVGIKEYSFPDDIDETISKTSQVSSIVEVDSDNRIIFGSNSMLFSPFIPGRAQKVTQHTLLLAGLKPGGLAGTLTTEFPLNFRSMSGGNDAKQKQKEALKQLLFGSTKPFVGAVSIYDTRAATSTFEYVSASGMVVSDAEINNKDGTYVVAESSLSRSGRIIKLDATGNIVFSYGEGLFSLLNRVSTNIDGSLVIST